MIRVLLADDHEIVRLGLRSVLEGAEDIEVVGEGESAADALRTVAVRHEVLPGMAAAGIEQARQFSWERVARETL